MIGVPAACAVRRRLRAIGSGATEKEGDPVVGFELLEQRMHFTAGMLDRNFSGDGRLALPTEIRFTDLASVDGGAVIVAGISVAPADSGGGDDASLYVRKYRKTGTLDRGFARNGTFRMPLLDGAEPSSFNARVVALPDGRIVIAAGDIILRLRSSGDFDPTFSQDGVATVDAIVRSAAVDENGQITLAAFNQILRLRANGRPAPVFSGDGRLPLPIAIEHGGIFTDAWHVVVAPDNDILVSGIVTTADAGATNALARITLTGALRGAWGTERGIRLLGFTYGGTPTAPALAADGTFFVGETNDDLYVSLFHFSSDGASTISRDEGLLPGDYRDQAVADIAVQADGKLVIAGSVRQPFDENVFGDNTAVQRLKDDRSPDTTFNGGNTTLIDHTTGPHVNNGAIGLSLTTDGDIITLSEIRTFNRKTYTLARVDGNGDAPSFASISRTGTLLVAGTSEDDRVTISAFDDGTTRVTVNLESILIGHYRRVAVDVFGGEDIVELNVRTPSTVLNAEMTINRREVIR